MKGLCLEKWVEGHSKKLFFRLKGIQRKGIFGSQFSPADLPTNFYPFDPIQLFTFAMDGKNNIGRIGHLFLLNKNPPFL